MANNAPKKEVKEPVDYKSLNKFLMGTLAEIKREDIQIDKAMAIARIADVVVKNNLTQLKYAEMRGVNGPNRFFEDDQNQLNP